jgi:1,4-dihydroxy-2-naphthoyl-CoA hydrolase
MRAGRRRDAQAFAARINEWGRSTMIGSHGTECVSAGQWPAVARLGFNPELTQLTGLFHAGAIIALADETATAAALWETNPTGEFRPELFPLTLQRSANLIRNANRSTLVAGAKVVHRGRTTLVVGVRVSDDRKQLVAKLVATLLTPGSPAVTPPADPPGR